MKSLLCIAVSPSNGVYVSPTNLTIKWIGHGSSTSSLYFGTNKDILPCISQQSAQSFVLKNLDLNTTYYWYVTGELQCYGGCSTGIYSFTTVPDTNLPYVITSPVFTHINTPPRVGGNVEYEGSSKLTECGISFGLTPDPDIGGTKFQIGNNSGLFSDLLPGLKSNTTYYLKAYATNNSGTVYGSETSFTTGQVANYKSIKDIEDNTYYIINIGNQVWMAENLETTRFNDGTLIPNITDDVTWASLNTPAYCWYSNNYGFKSTYGALYNWYIVDTTGNGHKNVCPAGWHVPNDTEWSALTTYLGGETVSGVMLKETGDYYWLYSTSPGNNSSDFSGLPGGIRYPGTPYFSSIRQIAYWWSSTALGGIEIGFNQTGASNYHIYDKKNGFSIRCLKDNN